MKFPLILSIATLCIATSSARADETTLDFFRQVEKPSASSAPSHQPPVAVQHPRAQRASQSGGTTRASWYGGSEHLARRTASGEVFRPNGMTAAHRTLPLGTRLLVSANGHSVMVRVNDRGPAAWTGRSLDLSKGAAQALGIIRAGTARVSFRVASL